MHEHPKGRILKTLKPFVKEQLDKLSSSLSLQALERQVKIRLHMESDWGIFSLTLPELWIEPTEVFFCWQLVFVYKIIDKIIKNPSTYYMVRGFPTRQCWSS